jgi:hypothetical protein
MRPAPLLPIRFDQPSREPVTSKTHVSIRLLLHTREQQNFVASGYDAVARPRVKIQPNNATGESAQFQSINHSERVCKSNHARSVPRTPKKTSESFVLSVRPVLHTSVCGYSEIIIIIIMKSKCRAFIDIAASRVFRWLLTLLSAQEHIV